ncbi:MAG TPA: response regulator [bacterium]|nr:response regulator [bacterium]HOL48937.1 response regulator [bacterium]HPQ18931.1 response regulator [bacterium]
MKILVVDDAAITRLMIRDILEKENYEIEEAETGAEGFEKYKVIKPDLVIMDITMPQVDGIRSIELIKNYDNKAKIIVCSALGQKDLVLKALKLGALDYIIKPFDEFRIKEAVNRILKSGY